jgi:hypothetical protein
MSVTDLHARAKQLPEDKELELPLEDGTMYSRRKGICPTALSFASVPLAPLLSVNLEYYSPAVSPFC